MLLRLFLIVFLLGGTMLSVSAYAGFMDYPTVRLQALDKSTARTVTLEAKVGTTIEYGSVFIKIRACRESEPLDTPESAAFLQIWEVPLNSDKSEWVFSGWMFASSPALSAMDHPVYDVWVLDCIDKNRQNAQAQNAQSQEEVTTQDGLEKPDQEGVIIEEDEDSKPRIVIEEDELPLIEDTQSDALSDIITPILE